MSKTNTVTRRENKRTLHQDNKKLNVNVTLRRWNQEEEEEESKSAKNTYLNKKRRNININTIISSQKLTINHLL